MTAPAQDPSHVRRCSHCDHWAVVERCTICGRESSGDAGISIEAGLRGELAEKDKEIARLSADAPGKLNRLCDELAEHANESPFTREEWDRVDKQTAELNRQLSETRAERDAARALLGEARCPECAADGLYHRTRDRGVCQWCDNRAAAIKKQGNDQ